MIFERIDFRSQKVLKKNPIKTPVLSILPDIYSERSNQRIFIRRNTQARQSRKPSEKQATPKVINLNFPAIPTLPSDFHRDDDKTSRSQLSANDRKSVEKFISSYRQKRKIVYSNIQTPIKKLHNN